MSAKTKTKSKRNGAKQQQLSGLTLSKLQKILQSEAPRANKTILKYKDFIKEAHAVLTVLSSDERRNFLNYHLDETQINKWNEKRAKVMDMLYCSFQHTPLSVSFYNSTYQHATPRVTELWFNFIHLILGFEHGAAECDLQTCDLHDCNRHLTIIDQLYAYVNTSDDSFYTINTQEFGDRGGFKLLLNVFNNAGINTPIPPIILCHSEYKHHEFLQHFIELDFSFLYCISPNEVRFSWIKQMLHNGHPIMSKKDYIHELLQKFYPKKKVWKHRENNDDDDDDIAIAEEYKDIEDEELYEMVTSDTADITAVSMNDIGVVSWLLATLPSLMDVRRNQKKLLKTEFDKYQDTAANATLIDTMLDYLYWDEKYIDEIWRNVMDIINNNKNEHILFRYIHNEYGGMVSMAMFMKALIDEHMNNNRNILMVLFDNDTQENNKFYFKFIKIIFKWNSLLAKVDIYLPFILSKIAQWDTINQQLFDELLISILSYIERYVSDKSVMMKIMKYKSSSGKVLSTKVNSKGDKTKQMVLHWIIQIFKLLNHKVYTQQLIYHLGVLHFKYFNDFVEYFTLDIYEALVHEFDIDIINYFVFPNMHCVKTLVVNRSENILCLLCRCCFDKAIKIFLFAEKDKKMDLDLFCVKQIGDGFNNVFLSLAQSVMPDYITNTKEMEEVRINIFRMLVECGSGDRIEIEKALLQKDGMNGKNAIQYAEENHQPLYNEMKQFIS